MNWWLDYAIFDSVKSRIVIRIKNIVENNIPISIRVFSDGPS